MSTTYIRPACFRHSAGSYVSVPNAALFVWLGKNDERREHEKRRRKTGSKTSIITAASRLSKPEAGMSQLAFE
jgi:hypothetical protein